MFQSSLLPQETGDKANTRHRSGFQVPRDAAASAPWALQRQVPKA